MLKVIDPGKLPITEVYCDCCHELIHVEGRDSDLKHEITMYISANFGFYSPMQGMINQSYCEVCALKAMMAIETVLDIKILDKSKI